VQLPPTRDILIRNPAQALAQAQGQAISAGGSPQPFYQAPPDQYLGPGVWSGVPVPLSAPQGPWFALQTGQVQATEAASVPNASYLQYNTTLQATGLIGSLDGAVIYLAGSATQLDGGQAWLMWRATSLATPGANVFNPFASNSTPGRWVNATPPQLTAPTEQSQIVAAAGTFNVVASNFLTVVVLLRPSPVGAVTVRLPAAASLLAQQTFRVKDDVGFAAANTVIVNDIDGVTLLDGALSFTFTENRQSIDAYWNGTGFSIL
jgi:hypothetical protein